MDTQFFLQGQTVKQYTRTLSPHLSTWTQSQEHNEFRANNNVWGVQLDGHHPPRLFENLDRSARLLQRKAKVTVQKVPYFRRLTTREQMEPPHGIRALLRPPHANYESEKLTPAPGVSPHVAIDPVGFLPTSSPAIS